MKCSIDQQQLIFKCEDYSTNSIVLYTEHTTSVCEYAPNSLLAYSADVSQVLLIIHDWKVLHVIADVEPGNTNKFWLEPLPGFDADSFPLILTSGNETYNLVNVREARMYQLVQGSSKNE